MKKGIQIVLLLLALLVAAGLAAPKFRADEYRDRIQRALQSGLGRQVTLGEVRYNLLTGPGFTVNNVTIGEDPDIGAEPIAYVDQLEAIPRLWSLFTGHLEFSSLRLEGAQLNLSRNQPEPGQYRWNFEQLLRPSIVATFPNISIRGGRINFEADHVKSVVYLLDSDLDITPPSSTKDAWHVKFEGKPARTDRPARGSGSFTARGGWMPSTGKLDLNLQLDRSELGDLIALIRGEDIGLQGTVSGKAHLAGPPSALAVDGRLNVAALHGWDQRGPQGESWPLDISGLWNVSAQQLKLNANLAGKVVAHYEVERYFSTPNWGISVTVQDLSVEPLVALARHLGAPFPEGLKASGQLNGELRFMGKSGGTWEGQATLNKAALVVPGSQPVQIESAQVLITQGQARLQPAHAVFPGGDSADFKGSYTMGEPAPVFSVTTSGMGVQSVAGIPLFSELKAGRWSGTMAYADREWSGAFALTTAEVLFPGFKDPVQIESADVKIAGDRVAMQRLRARVGDVAAQGEYRYEPGAPRPHRFRLGIAELETGQLEKLITPALSHKNGLFDFGARKTPNWLKQMGADGTVQIRVLHAGGMELQNFRTRVLWDETRVSLPNARAEWEGGQVSSRVLLDIGGRVPAYEAYSRFSGIAWKSGTMDADTVLQTNGFGNDTMKHMRSSGTFTGHAVLEDYETVSGKFELTWPGLAPKLTVSDLKLTSAGETATGKAVLQDDGTLLVEAANGTRQIRVAIR